MEKSLKSVDQSTPKGTRVIAVSLPTKFSEIYVFDTVTTTRVEFEGEEDVDHPVALTRTVWIRSEEGVDVKWPASRVFLFPEGHPDQAAAAKEESEPEPTPVPGISFSKTDQVGIHSRRRRWRVGCLFCGSLIHDATTGPNEVAASHRRHCPRP